MHELEPLSLAPDADRPRHAHQEIVDLLACALLRRRARPFPPPGGPVTDSDTVGLGFVGHERVNANPDHARGVRP
ncbi:hypothetical protein [Caldimonas sp.]|uniref:hypothetical protein n=1 Tax=Caldimonas sp. TaxID=2838790 RepID=UPI00391A5862